MKQKSFQASCLQLAIVTFAIFLINSTKTFAQYHQLKIPQSSPLVKECQRLGVTDICIEYSSPAVNNRTVWGILVPNKDESDIPWRAGANMATKLSFSHDVEVNGTPIKAGSYSIHFLPGELRWTLIISNNDNLWGSYYYDPSEDVTRIDITPKKINHRENLSYEFLGRTRTSIDLAMEWAKTRVPVTINVDLNQTVIADLKYQLRGHHANSWGAWYSAARYCYNNDVQLQQGLEWINRAISGGYNGFRAQRNFATLFLKSQIVRKIGDAQQANDLLAEAETRVYSADDYETLGMHFYRSQNYKRAMEIFVEGTEKHPNFNGNYLGLARCYKATGKENLASKNGIKAVELTPQHYKAYVKNYLKNSLKLEM